MSPLNKLRPAPFILFLLFALSACAQPGPETPRELPLPAPTVTLWPAPTKAAHLQCVNVETQPTPDAGLSSRFARPGKGPYDHVRGAELAPATIVVYSDFACPTCAALAEILSRLLAEHPQELRLVYRHFPILTAYPNAGAAVRAAESAHLQGKFWEMHDVLFQNQAEWTELSEPAFGEVLLSLAAQIGLETGQFESDWASSVILEIPEKTFQSGLEIGLPGAPLLLINGQIYSGPLNFSSLDFIVRMIALGERQFSTCPDLVIEPDGRYFATLKTEKGDLVLRLFADLAPLTVNSFVFLAQNGWYEQITFHHVIPGFLVQTGDPSGTGAGNPGYFTINENSSLKFERAGLVAMANSGPDTNGSQFFITLGPAPQLDGYYTIFGEVVSGLELLEQLSARDSILGQSAPPGDMLIGVTIEERQEKR